MLMAKRRWLIERHADEGHVRRPPHLPHRKGRARNQDENPEYPSPNERVRVPRKDLTHLFSSVRPTNQLTRCLLSEMWGERPTSLKFDERLDFLKMRSRFSWEKGMVL